jgi:hypothetical protein
MVLTTESDDIPPRGTILTPPVSIFSRTTSARLTVVFNLFDQSINQSAFVERSSIRSGLECCLLPSPCHERLGPPKHLSADNLSRLLRSLIVAARRFAPLLCCRAFDTPLGSVGSLLPAGVCYRALRRLPGQDFHLLEQRVFQDAPWGNFIADQTHHRHAWGSSK